MREERDGPVDHAPVPQSSGPDRGGRIWFKGQELTKLGKKEMRAIRGCQISMIFQEPMTSLNPVYTVGEPDRGSHPPSPKTTQRRRPGNGPSRSSGRWASLPPNARFHEYPHQMSGGMRQRVMIAMALSCKPSLLIADEPTTALDVTIQAQILELMNELKRKFGTAILFITHDLGVIAESGPPGYHHVCR